MGCFLSCSFSPAPPPAHLLLRWVSFQLPFLRLRTHNTGTRRRYRGADREYVLVKYAFMPRRQQLMVEAWRTARIAELLDEFGEDNLMAWHGVESSEELWEVLLDFRIFFANRDIDRLFGRIDEHSLSLFPWEDGVLQEAAAELLDGAAEALRACVLEASAATLVAAEAEWTEKLLQYMCRINRFELTLDLADKATGQALAACFDALQQRGGGDLDEAGLRAVRESYKL